EKTMGAYVDYDWDAELAGRPFRTNIGVRFVQTDLKAVGYLNASTPIVEKNDYDNWLPSLNVAWDATDDLVLRGSLSRTMTRAGLSSLAPSKAYGDVNFTVSGGNSQLDPLEADSIDLAAEWYFAEDSVLAFAWFHKDIKSFISSPSTEEPLRPVDRINVANIYPTQPELLDPSLIWTYSSPTNTDGTKLQGFELAYQQAFTSLPGFWGNFGFLGNYSYVDAETEVIRSGQSVTVPLEGMSQHSWNATLYYETDVWGARVAVNNRDDYITDNTGSNGNVAHGTTGPTHVDLSAFWHINDRFTLTFEGINLTDESERLFTTGDGTLDLVREYNNTGRQYYLGVRVRF
ncbi:TonB-dependent receptor, partial [Pseudomonadota bacterium]